MKWLVALALAILIGTAVGTNVINATRSDTAPADSIATPATSAPVTSATLTSAAVATSAEGVDSPTPTAASAATTISTPSGITLAELALHASSSDCWLAIDANAYDVTAYLSEHPGGSRTIIPWCGKEASTAFATEDGKGEHSPDARALLADYLLGPVAA